MNEPERLTQAKVIHGKMHILQDDGSWQEDTCKADWAKFDALTEEDMRRFAEEDGEADDFDRDIPQEAYRIRHPANPDAAE